MNGASVAAQHLFCSGIHKPFSSKIFTSLGLRRLRNYSISDTITSRSTPNINRNSTSLQNNPIEKYYNKVKIWDYNVNYVKVGHGSHAVFCYPGVLGKTLRSYNSKYYIQYTICTKY